MQVNDNEKSNYLDWHLLDVVPRLLDVVLNPIKQQLTRRQCAPPHDHGELSTQERLSECCCKLTSRVIAEMSFSALQAKVRVCNFFFTCTLYSKMDDILFLVVPDVCS